MEDTVKISCPVCGAEYLPVEIFIPEDFFGRPEEVIRDPADKIEFFLGRGMNFKEEYICDSCGAKMRITAKLSFDVDTDPVDEDEYVTTFERPKRIKLDEVELFDTDTGETK